MPVESSLITLFHLLVFAYWLGGDIGVFYSSTLLTDNNRDTSSRLTAGKILNDVDLVPRFCLLMALPSGLAAATVKGWLTIATFWIILAFIVALAWCALVWILHVRHTGTEMLRKADTILRYLAMATLAGTGLGAIAGLISLPTFISIKLLLLAFAISMGLYVRHALRDFGPAYIDLATNGANLENNAAIKKALDHSRPAVVMIWLALICAAYLGISTPT